MAHVTHPVFQQPERFYRHLFDAAPDVLVMIDPQGKIQVTNSRCRDVLGYASEDISDRFFPGLLAEWNRSDVEVMLTGLNEGTPMPEVEVDVLTRDGKPTPMMLEVRQMEGAEAGHFLIRLRDLREIKALEQEYRNLFDSIADALFIGDPESGQFYQANRQACELTGYSLGMLMGKDYDLVHSEAWEAVLHETEAANGRELSGREMRLRSKDGREIPVEVHLRVVPRGEDRIYIETVIDISERKALEARMRELRNEWDAFMRHELRSPLTPILAFSQILLDDFPDLRADERVPRYLDAIYQGGKRLEQLLDLTREVQMYERGEIALQILETDLYRTLRSAVQDAALGVGVAEMDTVERVRVIPHLNEVDRPKLIFPHDFQKLQRVLANLIKNALEHDSGQVTVRVEETQEVVRLSVQNWGDPIPEDRLQTIFEKFNTTKRDRKGTGLGTTIARLFVAAHGGRIKAASSKEEGTTFTVTLPKRTADP